MNMQSAMALQIAGKLGGHHTARRSELPRGRHKVPEHSQSRLSKRTNLPDIIECCECTRGHLSSQLPEQLWAGLRYMQFATTP